MNYTKLLYYGFVVFILGVIGLNDVNAQENDFQIWGDVSAKYKINKKFRLNTEFGIRSRENSELLKQYYYEIGGKYKVNKRVNFGLKYRYIDYYFQSKTSAQRINIDLVYSFKKWGRTRLSIRERYQYKWLFNQLPSYYNEINLRSRLFLTYDIRKSKIEPFFSIEHYLGLNGEMLGLSTRLRWTFGADIPINKWSGLSASYRIQQQLNKSNPIRAYVFMISYKVNLN